MSVRNALLALVAQQPAGVYRLKQMFEEQTCGAWPLNIGQVYQTMQRLERDGQVVSHLYNALFPFAGKSIVMVSNGSKTYIVDRWIRLQRFCFPQKRSAHMLSAHRMLPE